jgi:hypothetical protein
MFGNNIMGWHFDHCKGRSVKGINLLNALYHSGDVSIPVAFDVVKKPYPYCDIKTSQTKRLAEFTKTELMRSMIATCVANAIKFRYVLTDSWFASKENFEFILKKGKHFINALKDNRLVALTETDKNEGRYVLLIRRGFTNKDGSSDLACDGGQASVLYQRRWKLEEFH